MPVSCAVSKLKYISSIRYGLSDAPVLSDCGIPFLRATNIHAGKILPKNIVRVNPDTIPWQKNPTLQTNDIIVVRSGEYTGDSAIIPKLYNGSIAGFDMILRCNKASPQFVQYALLSKHVIEGQIHLKKQRVAQPHINIDELGSCVIPFPSITEQNQISSFLDIETIRLDSLISKKKVQLQLLQEKQKATLLHATTKGFDKNLKMIESGVDWIGKIPENWSVCKLTRISTKIGIGNILPQNMIATIGPYPVYGGNGIMGYVCTATSNGEDILVGRVGHYCGNVLCVPGQKWISDNVIIIETNKINKKYLTYLLTCRNLNQFATHNTQLSMITCNIVKNQYVLIPPTKTQNEIVEYLNVETIRFNSIQDKIIKSIALLKEYKKSLITASVAGQFKVCHEVPK